jgi:hypothetical protein
MFQQSAGGVLRSAGGYLTAISDGAVLAHAVGQVSAVLFG